MVDAPPGLPEVVAAIERAVLASRGGAQSGDQRSGIVGRDLHVTRVRQRREASDLHVFPSLATVGAPEEAHAHGEEDGARLCARHGQRVRVEHALVLGVAADLALEVRALGEVDEILSNVVPRLAAVAASQHAVDLEPGVDLVGVRRIDRHPDDPAREAHLDAVWRDHARKLAPALAAVVAPVDRHWRRPEVHDPGIARMDEDRPHLEPLVGEGELLPALAAIAAPVRPVLRAREDHVGVGRVNRDRLDVHALGQPLAQELPVVAAHRLPENPRQRPTHPRRRSDVNVRES